MISERQFDDLQTAKEMLTNALGVAKLQGEIQRNLDEMSKSQQQNTILGGQAQREFDIIGNAATCLEEARKQAEEAWNFLNGL